MGFFGDLFQGKSSKRSANDAAAAQSEYTNQGYTQQRNHLTQGYGGADTILSGYEKPGKAAYGQYADSIGANGTEGYGRAKQSFEADPFRSGQADATNRAIQLSFRRYNPTGQTGTQMTAVGRVGSDIYGSQVADYRDRLMGLGTQGMQIGQQRAQNAIGQGQEVGQSYLGQNNQLGSIEANRISGVQAAKTQGQNNIMKGVGGAAQLAMMGFAPVPNAAGATTFGNMGSAVNSLFRSAAPYGSGAGGDSSNYGNGYLSGYTNRNAYGGPR